MGPYVQGDGFMWWARCQRSSRAASPASYRLRDWLMKRHDGIATLVTITICGEPPSGYVDDLSISHQPFTPLLAAHMLCYLQDMNGPCGPLIAVPGSLYRSAVGDRPVEAEKGTGRCGRC
ncbi:MAG: hypothetical protein VX792_01600 [Candidatus Latescibacterota bacterium]|nr:hypothetical protein [Candidatus Latescibacterota bacterium]